MYLRYGVKLFLGKIVQFVHVYETYSFAFQH